MTSRASVYRGSLCALALAIGVSGADRLAFSDYRVLYDPVHRGLRANSGYAALSDGRLELVFTGGLEDDEAGMRPLLTETRNWGQTWSNPQPFGQDSEGSPNAPPDKSALWLTLFGPTANGTTLSVGYRVSRGVNRATAGEDLRWRRGSMLVGRREKGAGTFHYTEYPPGTFLQEQFAAPGIVIGRRIILQIWGAAHQGQNWQCGVLLSDDDGRSWRHRRVGFEPSLAIRDHPQTPAGFNEQTLFRANDGALLSIIRGRERLGRVSASPRDTWFFRSVSRDGGETWSKPQITDLAGTGAPASGITLPDGSLLMASRVPYSRAVSWPIDRRLFGLRFARSFDAGQTWRTEYVLQSDPEGTPFDDYYNAMNGEFVGTRPHEWVYLFGEFSMRHNHHRMLAVRVRIG